MTNKKLNDEWQDDSDEGSEGGSSHLEFKDFLQSGENLRDDLLSEQQKKSLLNTHKETHENRVKRQKDLRQDRQQLKEGKINLAAYREGLAANRNASPYKPNPILANKAQFSGIDRQINQLPTENDNPEANREVQDELQLRLRHRLDPLPRFNPKPRAP